MDNLYNRYGNLDDKDIKQLIQISEMLPYFAELSHNDIFVDCFSEREELAIVVAHGTPQTSESLYKDKVVGKIVLPENEPCVFFCKKTETSVRDLKGVTQEGKAVMQQAVPIKNDVGRVIGVLIEEQNVTDYIVQEEKIKYLKKCDSENGMGFDSVSNIAMDHIKEGVVLFDSNLNSVYVNKDAKRIYRNIGFEEEILGRKFSDLMIIKDDDRKLENMILNGYIKEREVVLGENTIQLKYKTDIKDLCGGMVMILEDISDRKKKEQELVYRQAAVQEMHHRIKNNLQFIISVLNLQIRRSVCEETRETLKENINRINSIAEIHGLLMNDTLSENISLEKTLRAVTNNIKMYTMSVSQDIEVNITGEDIIVTSDQAISIIVVINELITNSIKHGFQGRRKGVIDIYIRKGEMYTTVIVKDNGNGFSVKNIDNDKRKSLGLTLVEYMVKEKLKGNINVKSGNEGTSVYFDFKIK